MFSKTLDDFAALAAAKATYSREKPLAFFVSSMMAGAYVGIGIILIFTLGQQFEPALRHLVMGGCFGIALTLVVFAGSDLFTGHTMFMTIGLARGTVEPTAVARAWVLCWVGNLVGSALLALVFWLGGGGQILKDGADLIFAASAAKMGASATALIARGALCNWLVCLALWTSARATSDAAKCILIWWCLFAFIAAGFEHSIANMTIFSIALLGAHPASVSLRRRGLQSVVGHDRQYHRRRRLRRAAAISPPALARRARRSSRPQRQPNESSGTPLGGGRQIAVDIDAGRAAAHAQLLLGEAQVENAPVVGLQLHAIAAEHLLQRFVRGADFASARHIAGLGEKTVEVVVGARDFHIAIGENASAVKSAEILHGTCPLETSRRERRDGFAKIKGPAAF